MSVYVCVGGCCLSHSFAVHTHYEVAPPYPAFVPHISMACPGVAVFNTADSLVAVDVRVDMCRVRPSSHLTSDNNDETLTASESTTSLAQTSLVDTVNSEQKLSADVVDSRHSDGLSDTVTSLTNGGPQSSDSLPQLTIVPPRLLNCDEGDLSVGMDRCVASSSSVVNDAACVTRCVRHYSTSTATSPGSVDVEGTGLMTALSLVTTITLIIIDLYSAVRS